MPCDLGVPNRSWTRFLLAGGSLTVAPTIQSLFLQEQPCWEAAVKIAELQLSQNLPSRHQCQWWWGDCVAGLWLLPCLQDAQTLGRLLCLASGPSGSLGREASRGPFCMSRLWGEPGMCPSLGKAV